MSSPGASPPPAPLEARGHGYAALLGLRTFDTPGLLARIHAGLSFHAWERFLQTTGLPRDVVLEAVQISSRTLARRRSEGRLQTDESDRLLRLARVFARTQALFEGRADAARAWLLGEQMALGGATPLRYASTDVGAREVEALIGRLEHGVAS